MLPRMLRPPITSSTLRALGALCEAAGAAIHPHLGAVLPPLLALAAAHPDVSPVAAAAHQARAAGAGGPGLGGGAEGSWGRLGGVQLRQQQLGQGQWQLAVGNCPTSALPHLFLIQPQPPPLTIASRLSPPPAHHPPSPPHPPPPSSPPLQAVAAVALAVQEDGLYLLVGELLKGLEDPARRR